MPDDIDALLDEILVDASGDDEQLTSFEVAFGGAARFPFPARIVGTPIEVVRISYEGGPRRGLTAMCRREGETHVVSLIDIRPGPVTLETSRMLAAYRRWCGLPPLEPEKRDARGRSWVYRRVATSDLIVAPALALRPEGDWDPGDQYWGEDDAELDPIVEEIIAVGPRPEFEMEQVIPGTGAEDWDLDPVSDAAELHRAGQDREATMILKDLIARDVRCIDAWVHLGNIAFSAKGPKAALELYNTAVGIGEQSLPEDFRGVLPRGLIDNRPFLRALHGLGLCAWRQRRWDDAETVFTNLVWIDGGSTWTSLACLNAVRARQRWSSD